MSIKIFETKKSTDHLCDYCGNVFPECSQEVIEFGNGFGDDNVIKCSSFSGDERAREILQEQDIENYKEETK